MKLSCSKWCRIQEMLANLKCPGCFSVTACEGGGNRTSECECRLTMNTRSRGKMGMIVC